MPRPIIALLTDFGTRDAYAGVMKGVILEICPDVTLVDLTHDVPAHDVRHGARTLATCVPYYPAGTIFVAVVDPGVGSPRRAIAADTGPHRFVAPDNGVLSAVFEASPAKAIVEITAAEFRRPTVSRTFEGRDRFAPAAAHLARGVALAALGPPVRDPVRLDWPAPVSSPGAIEGVVDHVDHFGNLVTNIPRDLVEKRLADGAVDITLAGHPAGRLVRTYAEAAAGEACALIGSTDHLEIAVNGGRAATHFAAGAGTPVAVRQRPQS